MTTAIQNFFRRLGGNRRYRNGNIRIERLGRDEYKYIGVDRSIKVYVELQAGNPDVIIYTESIRQWLPPHEQENVTEEDKLKVVQGMCQFFTYYGETYAVK